jgi:hypothetical protein
MTRGPDLQWFVLEPGSPAGPARRKLNQRGHHPCYAGAWELGSCSSLLQSSPIQRSLCRLVPSQGLPRARSRTFGVDRSEKHTTGQDRAWACELRHLARWHGAPRAATNGLYVTREGPFICWRGDRRLSVTASPGVHPQGHPPETPSTITKQTSRDRTRVEIKRGYCACLEMWQHGTCRSAVRREYCEGEGERRMRPGE